MNSPPLEFRLDSAVVDDLSVKASKVQAPSPAHKDLPKWFEMLEATIFGGGWNKTTAKMCRPFTDGMYMGYLVKSPVDFTISIQQGCLQSSEPLIERLHVDRIDSGYNDSGNSTYKLPQFVLNSPWDIIADEDVQIATFPPFNRTISGFKPNSLLIDDCRSSASTTLPGHVYQSEVQIERGDPLFHVLAFHEDAVLETHEIRNYTNFPKKFEKHKQDRENNDARKDYYRTCVWKKKEKFSVSEEVEAQQLQESYPDGCLEFYSHDRDYGVAPPPESGDQFIEENLTGLSKRLSSHPNGELMAEQMKQIMQIATTWRTAGTTSITRRNGSLKISEDYDHTTFTEFTPARAGTRVQNTGERILLANNQWIGRTPDGYSLLTSEPFNHSQSRFCALTGSVDTDNFSVRANNPGFFAISDGETVELSHGMPVASTIPIHREGHVTHGVVSR